VCLIIFPPPIPCVPLLNMISLLSSLQDRVYVVSSKKSVEGEKLSRNVRIITVDHKASSNLLIRLFNYVHTQLRISYNLKDISNKIDFFLFSIGGEGLFIPILMAKLLKKKVILMPGGSRIRTLHIKKDLLSRFLSVFVDLNLKLIDGLIIYSRRLLSKEDFVKNQRKIILAHEHFVDFTKFAVKKKINERANVVGYIGRFSEEKGILNLVKSIPIVLKQRKDVRFILYGDGKLYDEIKKIIQYEKVEPYVKLGGWVSHEDVPNILNDIKLLVLPSYTEGLPNIMLEAMACGTPVLATQVGAIPDIIRDGETGFLLESNDPKHIAEKIIELFNKPALLEKVSKNAYEWVRENFNEEKTLESWRRMLQELETQ